MHDVYINGVARRVYCLRCGNQAYIKVLGWQRIFSNRAAAVGSMCASAADTTQPSGAVDQKLSDADINGLMGSSATTWFFASSTASNAVWIRTPTGRTFNMNALSMGVYDNVDAAQTAKGRCDVIPSLTSRNGGVGDWVGRGHGESCNRWFMGHCGGSCNCYGSGTSGTSCFSAGSTCSPPYTQLHSVAGYIYQGTAAAR